MMLVSGGIQAGCLMEWSLLSVLVSGGIQAGCLMEWSLLSVLVSGGIQAGCLMEWSLLSVLVSLVSLLQHHMTSEMGDHHVLFELLWEEGSRRVALD